MEPFLSLGPLASDVHKQEGNPVMCDKNLNNPGGRQTSPTDSPINFNPGLYDPLSCLPAVEDVLEGGDVFKGRNSINIVEEILHRVRQLKLVSSKIKKH